MCSEKLVTGVKKQIDIFFSFQGLYGIPNLSADFTHLNLSNDFGPNESVTEGSCDLMVTGDMAQLSLEIEKER